MSLRVFQIGFNKCATSALHHLFARSGVAALHSGGRFWRKNKHPAIHRRNPQKDIHDNIQAGRPALEGFDDFQAFFDMEYALGDEMIENFRAFPVFARDYPDARFILNIREKQGWLRSRLRHNDGQYLNRAMKRSGLDRDGVLQEWSDDFDRHNDAVRAFFADRPDRLMVFDTEAPDVPGMVEFVKPEITLKPRHFTQVRVTDKVAKSLNWAEPHV